ncbi:MAG: hypothetical protein ACLP8S_26150 [Solirubrobacteraceae bacterium]
MPHGRAQAQAVADPIFLSFYPSICVGLWKLIKSRFPTLSGEQWLDCLIGVMTAATVTAALIVGPLTAAGSTTGGVLTVGTELGDLILLAMLAGLFAMTGWRAQGVFSIMVVALLSFWLSDLNYLLAHLAGTYGNGGCVGDCGWVLACALMC